MQFERSKLSVIRLKKRNYCQQITLRRFTIKTTQRIFRKLMKTFMSHLIKLQSLKRPVLQKNASKTEVHPFQWKSVKKLFKVSTRAKAADIYELTIENVIFAGQKCKLELIILIIQIFTTGTVPTFLKLGLLSPFFKYKG